MQRAGVRVTPSLLLCCVTWSVGANLLTRLIDRHESTDMELGWRPRPERPVLAGLLLTASAGRVLRDPVIQTEERV